MIDPSVHGPPVFLDNRHELERRCRRWLDFDAIALDTEFERTRTYFSRPALVQLCDGQASYLIDPLAFDDFEPLAALLTAQRVTKVMHACEGDNEVLELLTGVQPGPVFDTQLAAAFAGHGYSLGYRRLVDALLGVELSKEETRSDWHERPLSDAQVAYAVSDVAHLLPMYGILGGELREQGREEWLREETERMAAQRMADRHPEQAFRRIRQGRGLGGVGLATLKALAAWRETEARRRNLPRQMVLKDALLVELAHTGPIHRDALEAVDGMSAGAVRRYADVLTEIIGEAERNAAEDVPESQESSARAPSAWIKRLKSVLNQRAEELSMPAALLARTRTLEALASNVARGERTLPEDLSGWRGPVIGEPLMAALEALGSGSGGH
jgi:ribonuclease D